MPFDDLVEQNGRLVWNPVLASPGDVIVCPEGHVACDVIKPVRRYDLASRACFANWRSGVEPAPHSGRPNCHICGAPLFLTWWGVSRPLTQDGVRLLPGDPNYDEPPDPSEAETA